MKQLIVYAGANGAGKSSLRAGGADPVDVEIDPDRIARQINPADPRSVDFAAGKEALRLFDRTLAEGRSLSLETTLTGRTVLGRMQAVKDAGYDVTLRYIAVRDATINIDRVQARAVQGGHGVGAWMPGWPYPDGAGMFPPCRSSTTPRAAITFRGHATGSRTGLPTRRDCAGGVT